MSGLWNHYGSVMTFLVVDSFRLSSLSSFGPLEFRRLLFLSTTKLLSSNMLLRESRARLSIGASRSSPTAFGGG